MKAYSSICITRALARRDCYGHRILPDQLSRQIIHLLLSPTFRSGGLFLASSRLLLYMVEFQRLIQTNGDSGMMVLGQVDDPVLLHAQPSTPEGLWREHTCDTAHLPRWTASGSRVGRSDPVRKPRVREIKIECCWATCACLDI